ncbi:GDYXXLXY domain-containing protein [Bacillus sp. 165]|uniref:GDYXXLXY domain-containing protein n=1 Tax=Bacillus sp. 165 TaxID=1529117 RepID=UPI001ADB9073|nr:GDYXXLXY domain-containing protein [Bacillus sp. 165]MBO9128185.1 GDYXXLXY domain-containing protein [Bacillus sp. 165]
MKKRTWWIVLLVICQLVSLSGMAGVHYYTKWYGKDIILQTEPVDPQDLFYGDYVYLNYTISTVPYSKWEGTERITFREKVYVLLRKQGNEYEVKKVVRDKPNASSEEVVLRAKAMENGDGTLRLEYGLERLYVKEGTGKAIEEQAGRLKVHVKVSRWHQFIEGTE